MRAVVGIALLVGCGVPIVRQPSELPVVEGPAPIDADTVVERVAVVLKRQPQTPVLVKADRSVPYGDVVNGMVLLQEAGAEKVGFITDPAETRDSSKR